MQHWHASCSFKVHAALQANAMLACVLNAVLSVQQHLVIIQWSCLYTQRDISCNTGSAGEAVPGSEPLLPPALPSALPQPSLGEKVPSKAGRASKPAAKPAKAVELPPEIFQRDEPFVLPPAVSKVTPSWCLQALYNPKASFDFRTSSLHWRPQLRSAW